MSLFYDIFHMDCNGKIIAEYDEDELEFIKPKSTDIIEEYQKHLKEHGN